MKQKIDVSEVINTDEFEQVLEEFKDYKTLTFMESEDSKRKFAKKQVENGHVIVEKHDDVPVGFVCLYCNDMESKAAFVTAFALSDKLGFAKGLTMARLIKRAFEIAFEAGMESVKLEVDDDNARAIKLYEAMGFRYLPKKGEHSSFMEMNKSEFIEFMEKKLRNK